MFTRKEFLQYIALLAGGAYAAGCRTPGAYDHIGGSILGASAAAGHQLRDGLSVSPQKTIRTGVLIAGGGVAGLSAARKLRLSGKTDFLLAELEPQTGGNSLSGGNSITNFPFGAHYLPLPNPENTALMDFLTEAGLLKGFDKGLPVYDELSLVYEPAERLYRKGRWQEGIIPQVGLSPQEHDEMKRFLALMQTFRDAKDSSGRHAFDIPAALSSRDPQFLSLDALTMEAWLQREGFRSEPLRWYVDYCCRDDYGAGIKTVSAWAGIHYFAARRGKAANADASAVLTWPEGNGRLVQHLRRHSHNQTLTGTIVYRVQTEGNTVLADCWNYQTREAMRIVADHCILAMPQFIGRRILGETPGPQFTYAPWLVANVHLRELPVDKNLPVCWDNVIYGQQSLGYIYAQHQTTDRRPAKSHVITLYWPLDQLEPADSRRKALQLQHRDWVELCMAQLEQGHPHIAKLVTAVDCWIWGHGMIRPIPGFMTTEIPGTPPRVHFAHSDLSGISIFEEAFYQGESAAMRCLG
ncbi:FAD-dependent oxidoreductase [Chitinophaga rhizosphaerae]|uniref:FAD-dependent oxidoreductase n=1 Tax=Chitinophaga rhizosphaerae TaxID=1864947 RepID=UPI000F808F6D|nr:FAD-dependent oxidoreductase [Chitinophaga rhizosphaerae]